MKEHAYNTLEGKDTLIFMQYDTIVSWNASAYVCYIQRIANGATQEKENDGAV